MKHYDFRCENGHVFEVTYDKPFHADDLWACPECEEPAEWSPASINIGAFSAALWTGERVPGITTATSLREWEKEHVIEEPGLEAVAKENLSRRMKKETEEIKDGVRHHARNLLKIKSEEQRSNYVRDHKPAAVNG